MSSEIQDYNKWTRDFSNSFGYSSQRFLNFFSTFESMIDEYFDNYSLLPPYEKQTNDFLYRFVPEISSKIYRLSNIKDDALESSVNQLLKILNLCVFLAEQCDFKLNKTMKLILDQKQNIYKSNNQLFQMLCELFVSYDCFNRLVARCRECKPNIKNLSLVFSIREKLFHFVEIELSEVLPILPDFISQFKGDSIRTIDSAKLNSIIQKNIIPTFPSKTNQQNNRPTIDFSPFFHFCELLIMSGNLDKQLLGIKFLNSYLSNSAKDMSSFNSWIKSNAESKQLLDYLIQTPELHLELIKSLEPLFIYLSSSHLVKVDFFNQIFLTAKKMEKEESNQFFKLIIKSLDAMSNDENTIKKFICEHKESSDLLAAFVLDSKSVKISSDCISYLFENKALNEIKSIVNNKTRGLILDETFKIAEKNQRADQIDYEEVQIATEILNVLINTSSSLKNDFGQNHIEFINKIILGFGFKRNLKFVYSILSSYYNKANIALEIEILPEILDFHANSNNDDLWNFLIKIIKSNNQNSMKKDVINSLYSIINDSSSEYFPISTPSFIEFFRYLILLKCSNEYYLRFDSYSTIDVFKFRKWPSNCIQLITKLYFTTKEHEMMNSFMFEILTKQISVPVRDEFNLFTTQFIPKLNDQKIDNNIKYYIIKLIYDVLTTIEKGINLEDYGEIPKRRHCEITDESIELSLVTKTKDQKNTYLIRKIHASTNDYCDALLKRVRKIFNDSNAKIFNQTIPLYSNSQLKNVSIKKSCQIDVEGNYRPLRESILSLMLTDSNSTIYDPLFKILKNVNTDKKEDFQLAEIISKLLQFLPSYQNVNLDLSKCENYYLLIYCIQIIAGFSTMDDEKINSLVNIFHSRKYKRSDLQIIQIFIRFFDKEKLPKHFELLIDPLFECINSSNTDQKKNLNCYDIYNLNNNYNQNYKDLNHILLSISNFNNNNDNELSEKAIKLLKKLAKNRNDSDSILQKNVDDVVEMSLYVKDSTVRKIFKIIDCISDLQVFFSKFIQKIPIQLSDNKLVFRLFFTLWRQIFSKEKMVDELIFVILFKKCIEWIDFPSIDILRLCLIIRKTIKAYVIANKNISNDIIKYTELFVSKLFDKFFIIDSKELLTPILRLIEKFGKYDTKFNTNHSLLNITDKCLVNLFSKVGQSNHYNMSSTKYSKTLFTGLQNIGSTCFVNTIIQPLFYTYQFRYNVLFNREESKDIMYNLFVKMLTTQKGYVKMMDFLVQFEKDIEIHRQQDCVEFLLILTEKLDKISYNLFKGVLTDHFMAVLTKSDNKIAADDGRDEDFIHLSVNVQKFTNLEDSLKSLFGSSVVISGNENQSSESLDSNLQKYSRIKVAPQFLMICLNRFEYNLKTFKKIKINSKFSFPFILDISEFVEENKSNDDDDDVFNLCKGIYKYELYAVSLHNGSADSGHYTALVKINNNWTEFNDRSSRIITENELKTLSFGANVAKEPHNERNAYVLYYRRILEIKENKQNDDNNNDKLDTKIVDLYDEDKINQIFLRFSDKIEKQEHLSMYHTDDQKNDFKKYSLSDMNSNLNVLISYFFNVFCHSTSKDAKDYVEKMIQKINSLEKTPQKGDTLYDFLQENYCPKLIETFMKCKTDQILLSIRNLLLKFCENPKSKQIFTFLISNLSSFKEKPEKVESITPLFLNYVTFKPDHVKYAIEMNWVKIILEFFDFCSSKLSESSQKKVRLTDLLILLKNLITTDDKSISESNIKAMSKSIMDSIKKNLKFLLMNSFNSLPLLDLFNSISVYCPVSSSSSSSSSNSSQFIKLIESSSRSDSKHKLIMNFIIGLIECDTDPTLILDCLSYEMRMTDLSSFFKDYLRSSNENTCNLQHFLVDNYSQFIMPELLSSNKETRLKAEHLTYDMFIEVKPPSNSPQYTNSRSTNNRSPTENLIRFSKGFSENFFDRVNKIISEMTARVEKTVRKLQGGKTITTTTISSSRKYDYYIFENFNRVLKWTLKRVNNCNKVESNLSNEHYIKVFDNIYQSFTFIDSNNDRSMRFTPDSNFRSILDVFKVFPYDTIMNNNYVLDNNDVVNKIEFVVFNSLDFVPRSSIVTDQLAKILLIISTIKNNDIQQNSSNNLLIRIYENPRFLDFFKTMKKVRQDIMLFEKFYASSITAVLENSELYRKESVIILDNPLNFSIEYSLLTTVLNTIYSFLPGKFIIKVILWIAKCINEQKNPPSFMETVLSINSSVREIGDNHFSKTNRIPFEELFVKSTNPLKSYSSQPVSASKTGPSVVIDKNCEILKTFDTIGYKGKMKFDDSIHYFSMIKYICKGCKFDVSLDPSLSYLLRVPDEILLKLLNKLSLIDGKNFSYFAFELTVFFELAFEEQKYAFVSQFIEGIFPLSSISNWFYYTKIHNNFLKFYSIAKINEKRTTNDELNLLFKSLVSVTENSIMLVDLNSYYSKNAVLYIQSFFKDTEDDVFKRIINEVVDQYNASNDNNMKKIITSNLKKITQQFPAYKEFIKSLIKL